MEQFITANASEMIRNEAIQKFYQEYGIKQYDSFSGGFKYR